MMDSVRLWTLLLVIPTLAVRESWAVLRRQKRDDLLLRRLESLTIRVENIEIELSQEKRKSESLKVELDALKNRIPTSDEKPGSHGGVSELPEAAVKTLAHLARKTFQADLEVLTSGMIAEKQRSVQTERAVELCKTTLNSHSSRLDSIEGKVSELEDRLTNFSTTAMTGNKSCSQCSAHAPAKRTGTTSDQCPLFNRLSTNKETLSSVDLGPTVCRKQNYVYALYVTAQKILVSPQSEPGSAEIRIIDMAEIGGRYIRGNPHAYVSLSGGCDWSNIVERKHYLILTEQGLKAQDQRSTLSLENSVIVALDYDGLSIQRFTTKLMYNLRRRNWKQLCRSRK